MANPTDSAVAAVRRFNRFYLHRVGALNERLLQSRFAPAEARVLYELAQQSEPTATGIARSLGLDAGHLSRMLRGFTTAGLLRRTRSPTDGRRILLALTAAGRQAFAGLDARLTGEMAALLQPVSAQQQARLLRGMRDIEEVLQEQPLERRSALRLVLRAHRPGDLGWIVHRHGVLYADEYGWNEEFEALVADIVAQFVRRFTPGRERCWIAEHDGEIVGSVLLVRKSAAVAQLRLLLVEPHVRGVGVGARLIDECIRFARQARYRTLTLWTNDVLHAARRLYERAGFVLVKEEPFHGFGQDLTSQTWELQL
jgi:DNA-binding MarR family transcriptional regulator/GNAT superfamily N-acetyltransferase